MKRSLTSYLVRRLGWAQSWKQGDFTRGHSKIPKLEFWLEVMNKKRSWSGPLGWLGVTWHVIVITPGSHNASLTNRQVRYRSDQVNLGPKKIYGTVFEIVDNVDLGYFWFSLVFVISSKVEIMFWCTLSLIHSINGGNCVTLARQVYCLSWISLGVDIVTRRWLEVLEFESNRATQIVSTYWRQCIITNPHQSSEWSVNLVETIKKWRE